MLKSPYAAVVGGVNIDICGKPFQSLVPGDSNPGRVETSLGGVGRNIAHNMRLLGVPTMLVTALGDDQNAQRVRRSCDELGLDLSHAVTIPGATTSTYLVITDQHGEMELAVSDMGIYDSLTPEILAPHMEAINAAAFVVCDTNLPQETLIFLGENTRCPLFVDPVSTAKAEKIRPILGRIHTLKPNKIEAQMLSGVEITDEISLQKAANKLLESGLRQIFISLGPEGVLAADRNQILHLPNFPAQMVNATGCGDAFMAAIAWSYWERRSLEDTARAGLAAANIALAGRETINPAMSPMAVEAILSENRQ